MFACILLDERWSVPGLKGALWFTRADDHFLLHLRLEIEDVWREPDFRGTLLMVGFESIGALQLTCTHVSTEARARPQEGIWTLCYPLKPAQIRLLARCEVGTLRLERAGGRAQFSVGNRTLGSDLMAQAHWAMCT